MAGIPGIRGARRLYPRPWDYSCYLFWRMRKAFVEAINSIFKDCPAVVVVDFGCGEKPYEPLFAGHIQKYIGVDVSRNPKADIIISANDRVPIDGDVADVVLSVQVLEHVVDVDLYFCVGTLSGSNPRINLIFIIDGACPLSGPRNPNQPQR